MKVPTEATLRTCARTHKDGFGVMWRDGDKVRIIKGLFDADIIIRIVNRIPVDVEAAFHFRMATHGGVKAGNCHPFPLTGRNDALTTTYGAFDSGLMHNGIITDFGDRKSTLSDTMNFVKYLDMKTNHRFSHEHLNYHIKGSYGKFVVFTPGVTHTFGYFVKDGDLMYSNTTYKDYTGFLAYPKSKNRIVIEVDPKRVTPWGKKAYKYLGVYGTLINYRGVTIFAEDGYSMFDLNVVKDEIDLSLTEGEYEGLLRA